jgi:hypothetical protein
MTAHDLFTLADTLVTGATMPQPSADSISSLPVFEASNASGELFHLRPGQSVPWHRHLHGDDIFYGSKGMPQYVSAAMTLGSSSTISKTQTNRG